MASSRILPTTPNTSSYDSGGVGSLPGGGNPDYSTLQGWEEATDIDLVTANTGEILEVYSSQVHDDTDTLDAATTDSSYFRLIMPASGEGHSGVPLVDGSMAAFVRTADTFVIRLNEGNSRLYDLVGKISGNTASTLRVFPFGNTASGGGAIVGCLVLDSANVGAGDCRGFRVVNANGTINCLADNMDGSGFTCENVGAGQYSYNDLAVNNGAGGFDELSGTFTVKNGLASNNTGGDYVNTPTLTTCADSDGSGDFTLNTWDVVGDPDWHYVSGSDGIGDGTDLSGTFDDDIDGDTRSAWDCGFDEFVAAGGHPAIKRFGGVPFAGLNSGPGRGVW